MDDPELVRIRQKKEQELLKQLNAPQNIISDAITATDSDFSELINSHTIIAFDFWAPWCGPCKMIGPIIDQLAKKYAGKIIFAKLNIDNNPNIPLQLGICGIPTMLVYKNRKIVHRIVGYKPQNELERIFDSLLN